MKLHGVSCLTQTFCGDYLILCDGAHSALRQQLGLRFEGYDLPMPVIRLSTSVLPACLEEQLAGVSYLQAAKRSLSCLKMSDGWRFVLRPSLSEVYEATADTFWARQCLADSFADLVPPRWWFSHPAKRDSNVAQRCPTVGSSVFLSWVMRLMSRILGGNKYEFWPFGAYSLASCLNDAGLIYGSLNVFWLGLTES